MTAKRLKPADRKAEILQAAMAPAEQFGYNIITLEQIAEAAGCTKGLVTHHFGTMTQFRRSLMRAAVASGNVTIIAQGIVTGDTHAKKAPYALRQRAITEVMGAI